VPGYAGGTLSGESHQALRLASIASPWLVARESVQADSPFPARFRYTGNGMHLTLLNDILFKGVFGTQRHSEALRGLLNAILGLQGADRIAEITLLNPLREKEGLGDKGTAVLAHATTNASLCLEALSHFWVEFREACDRGWRPPRRRSTWPSCRFWPVT